MTMLINPGSHIAEGGEGQWTNTFEGALAEAERWLARMHDEGMKDVSIVTWDDDPTGGRWTFQFEHAVTRIRVALDTHGIAPLDAYMKGRVFSPRVYWNGSSLGSPELEDFALEGYSMVRTFMRDPS